MENSRGFDSIKPKLMVSCRISWRSLLQRCMFVGGSYGGKAWVGELNGKERKMQRAVNMASRQQRWKAQASKEE